MATSSLLNENGAIYTETDSKEVEIFKDGIVFLSVQSGMTLGLLKLLYSSDARSTNVLQGIRARSCDAATADVILQDDYILMSGQYDAVTQDHIALHNSLFVTSLPLNLPSLNLLTAVPNLPISDAPSTPAVAKKKKFICDTCHIPFVSQSKFIRHKRIHTDERPFVCVYCGGTFAHHQDLRKHRDELHMTNKSFKCACCPKTFSTRAELEGHQWRHTGQKNYKCSLCNKSYTTKGNLKHHINKHVGVVVEKCSFCSHQFTSHSALESHMTKHTGVRPYKCRHCRNTYATGGQLTSHERIHTGEKPYSCTICLKAFRLNSTRLNHERRHSNTRPHTCHVCGRSFTQIINLQQHLITHEDRISRQVSCPFCAKKIFAGRNMRKHLMRHKELELSASEVRSIVDGLKPTETAGKDTNSCQDSEAASKLRCSLCEKVFPTAKALRKHIEKAHNDQPSTSHETEQLASQRSLDCDFCKEIMESHDQLREHIIRVHPAEATDMGLANVTAKNGRKKHDCRYCQRRLSSKRGAERHMVTCSLRNYVTPKCGKLTYRCWFCTKRLSSPASAVRHMTSEHDDLDSLKRTIEAVAKLDEVPVTKGNDVHQDTCTDLTLTNGSCKCPHCRKEFHRREAYEIHLLTHQVCPRFPPARLKSHRLVPILPKPPDTASSNFNSPLPFAFSRDKEATTSLDSISELTKICRSLPAEDRRSNTETKASIPSGLPLLNSNNASVTKKMTSVKSRIASVSAARPANMSSTVLQPATSYASSSTAPSASDLKSSSPFLAALQRLSSSIDFLVACDREFSLPGLPVTTEVNLLHDANGSQIVKPIVLSSLESTPSALSVPCLPDSCLESLSDDLLRPTAVASEGMSLSILPSHGLNTTYAFRLPLYSPQAEHRTELVATTTRMTILPVTDLSIDPQSEIT